MALSFAKILGRPLTRHPHSFPECVLQGSTCFSRMIVTSSLEQREEHFLPFLSIEFRAKEK